MGKAVRAERRALERHRGRKVGVHVWLEDVTCGCGDGGRWGQKDQILMALLFMKAPSKGFKMGSGRFRPLLCEGVGCIIPSPGLSLLSHSGMFYLRLMEAAAGGRAGSCAGSFLNLTQQPSLSPANQRHFLSPLAFFPWGG